MHPVLLLDEILRSIFEDCDRKYLVSAALTCKAWNDPALDVVWSKLDSCKPWFDFLENPVQLASFARYARRVKHIVLQHDVIAQDECFEGLTLAFPTLRTLRLAITKSTLPLYFLHHSPNLETMDVSLSFKSRSTQADAVLNRWFQSIARSCGQLRHIRLRGSIPEGVNTSLCQMTTLESASLRLGQSISPAVLTALRTFPFLSELEIHAGNITTGGAPSFACVHSFPALTKLHMRAKSAFLETFLSYLSPMTLQRLHIELDDETTHADSWLPVLRIIATKTSTSLERLCLEHHYNIDDIQPPNSTTTANSASHGFTFSSPTITFSDISSLRSLKRMNHFSCNITLPPLITDLDFEQILSWWPRLKHLDLGTLPSRELIPSYPITLSAQALSTIADKVLQLEYLSVPCSLDDSSCSQNITSNLSSNRLQSLLISTIKTTDPLYMAKHLHNLFPCLRTLECTEDSADALDDIVNYLVSSAIHGEVPLIC